MRYDGVSVDWARAVGAGCVAMGVEDCIVFGVCSATLQLRVGKREAKEAKVHLVGKVKLMESVCLACSVCAHGNSRHVVSSEVWKRSWTRIGEWKGLWRRLLKTSTT